MTNKYLPFKRLLSIFGAITGILFCCIFIWWWAIIINTIVTKGHPFFKQERIGRNKQPFNIIKLRSLKITTDPYIPTKELIGDRSTGRFGRFIRRRHIDETFQLFNILKGEMSFIGPRPLINIGTDYMRIRERIENGSISLRPGLSCYETIYNKIDGKLDKKYKENISLTTDLYIFIKTIGILISGK